MLLSQVRGNPGRGDSPSSSASWVCWTRMTQMTNRLLKEVWKSNFRQYGQLKSRLEKSSQKKEDQHATKVTRKKAHTREMFGKSRIAVFFSMICGSGCSKSRFAKAAGAEVAVQHRNENWLTAVARITCVSQKVQNNACSDHFLEVPMSNTTVARSTCVSQKVQNTACSDHFLKFHMCKSKCQKKTAGFGPLFEVQSLRKVVSQSISQFVNESVGQLINQWTN